KREQVRQVHPVKIIAHTAARKALSSGSARSVFLALALTSLCDNSLWTRPHTGGPSCCSHPPEPLWRTHSCGPRRDSSRRHFADQQVSRRVSIRHARMPAPRVATEKVSHLSHTLSRTRLSKRLISWNRKAAAVTGRAPDRLHETHSLMVAP